MGRGRLRPGRVRDPDDLPAPQEILSWVLARRDVDRLSAHQVVQDSLHEVSSLARLGAIFEDAARSATDQWLRHIFTQRGLAAAIDDPQWPSLVTRAREAALAGHDIAALVEEAIRMRAIEVAYQAGELIRRRWRDLRAWLSATTGPLPWAPALGPRPPDPSEEAAWLTAGTAVTAYRERYEVPEHTAMLGPRPAASRPDARAGWDHACHQADRYLARRLHNLDDQQLADLDARQQATIDNPPPFDPSQLGRARQDLNTSSPSRGGRHVATGERRARPARPAELLVQRLERAAQAHRHWRHAATEARAVQRQIALEEARRRRNLALVRPTRR